MVTQRQSRSLARVWPYGSGVEITKHECVGRVWAVKKELASTSKGAKERTKVLTAGLKDA